MPRKPTVPVFDIGNVLLDWDPRHLYRKLFDDERTMEQFLATVCTPAWNLSMDAGGCFDDAVAELVVQFPEQEALIRAYHDRWREMVPRAFDDTVGVLHDLKASGRRVYSITNFSQEKFALECARWPFLNWFDDVVVSGRVKALKPEPEIYRILLDSNGLAPEDCLFIDDRAENVEGARAVGMQGVIFTGAAPLRRTLEELEIL